MEPSSLVFVAIVALWLLALVPGLVKRRHHWSAGSAGRSSASARVLARRTRRAAGGAVSMPLVEAPVHVDDVVLAPGEVSGDEIVHAPGETVPEAPVLHPERPSAPPVTASARVSGRSGAVPSRATVPSRTAARTAARRRAVVLAVLLVATIASWGIVLAAGAGVAPGLIGGISWLAALPATTLLGLDVVALRASARARSRRRARPPARGASPAPSPASRQRSSNRSSRPVKRGRKRRSTPAAARPRPQVRQNPLRQPVMVSEDRVAFDVDAVVAAEREAVAEAARQAEWTPVPVPPPTYTLKPVVSRGAPAPLDLAQRLDLAEGAGVVAAPAPQRDTADGSRVIFSSGAPRPDATEGGLAPAAVVVPATPAVVVAEAAPAPSGVLDPEAEVFATIDLDEVLARRRAVNG